MIHVFHGFLGGPSDFKFLQGADIIIHDLYAEDFNPTIAPDDVLIGYSMGGRIALELASKAQFNVKKIVLMNAHPGLETQEEKDRRKIWEDEVLEKLKTESREDFFDYWNSLPLFDFDTPLAPIETKRYELSKVLFDKFRLSRQDYFLPEMEQHKEKILYVVGVLDNKYFTLAEEVLLPHDITVKGIPGGHRLFQYPAELKTLLDNEGIL